MLGTACFQVVTTRRPWPTIALASWPRPGLPNWLSTKAPPHAKIQNISRSLFASTARNVDQRFEDKQVFATRESGRESNALLRRFSVELVRLALYSMRSGVGSQGHIQDSAVQRERSIRLCCMMERMDTPASIFSGTVAERTPSQQV